MEYAKIVKTGGVQIAIAREPRPRDGAPCIVARCGDGVGSQQVLVAFMGDGGCEARDAAFDGLPQEFTEHLLQQFDPTPIAVSGGGRPFAAFARIIAVRGMQMLLTREPGDDDGPPSIYARTGDGLVAVECVMTFVDGTVERARARRDAVFGELDAALPQVNFLHGQLAEKLRIAAAALSTPPTSTRQ